MNDLELIRGYINQTLSDEEIEIFHTHLENNESFKSMLVQEQIVTNVVRSNQSEKIHTGIQDAFSTLKKENYFKEAESKNSSKKYVIGAILSSAAMFLFLFMFSSTQYNTSTLFYQGDDKLGIYNSDVSRSANESQNHQIKEHLIANDWEKAISEFNTLNVDPSSDFALYHAYALMKNKDHESSRLKLDQISSSISNELSKHKLDWIELQLLVNSKQDYHQQLDRIIQNENHTFNHEAVSLKQKLNSFWRLFNIR